VSDINAGQGEHQLVGGALERFGHSWQKPQQLTAFRQTIFRVEAGIQFSIEEPDVTLLRARLIYKRIPNQRKATSSRALSPSCTDHNVANREVESGRGKAAKSGHGE